MAGSRIRSVRKGSRETCRMETTRPPGGGGAVRSNGRDSTTRCSPGTGRPLWGAILKMRVLLVGIVKVVVGLNWEQDGTDRNGEDVEDVGGIC